MIRLETDPFAMARVEVRRHLRQPAFPVPKDSVVLELHPGGAAKCEAMTFSANSWGSFIQLSWTPWRNRLLQYPVFCEAAGFHGTWDRSLVALTLPQNAAHGEACILTSCHCSLSAYWEKKEMKLLWQSASNPLAWCGFPQGNDDFFLVHAFRSPGSLLFRLGKKVDKHWYSCYLDEHGVSVRYFFFCENRSMHCWIVRGMR